MSYYHAKKTAEAKRYLDARDAEQAIAERRVISERDANWLTEYRASGRARTGFDWRPRWPLKPPEEDNGKEIIEGEYTVVANADAAGERSGEAGLLAKGQDAAGGRLEAPQGEAQDFTEEDRTPF